MTILTATVAEARNNFSRIAEQVNKSGREVVVFRHSKPWVKISPAGTRPEEAAFESIMDTIIAKGLADYDEGNYVTGIDAARAEIEKHASIHG